LAISEMMNPTPGLRDTNLFADVGKKGLTGRVKVDRIREYVQ